MTSRDDLVGHFKEVNQWGNKVYEMGLIETYLPGECDYNSPCYEGQFIASLCLYLLSGSDDPSPYFTPEFNSDEYLGITHEHALFFMKNCIFHMIPKEKFLDEISKYPKDEDKVKAVCELIYSDIMLSDTALRFHDIYINSYISFQQRVTEAQSMLFCNKIIGLLARNNGRYYFQSWNDFQEACVQNGITLNQAELKFYSKVRELEDKKKEFIGKPEFQAIEELCHELRTAGKDYFSKPHTDSSYNDFKSICDQKIVNSGNSLNNHRELKKILLSIATLILTLGVAIVVDLALHKGKLTLFSTDRALKAEAIKDCVDEAMPGFTL